MDVSLAGFWELADREFEGGSFNGSSLMKTLESLSAVDAAFTGTFEGYSAWEVALHCLYCKYVVADAMGAAGPLEPYPYPKKDFVVPSDCSPGAWTTFLAYLRTVHRVCMDAIRGAGPDRLDAVIPAWKTPVRTVVPWLVTHDSYHTAQIRSMGIPGLREPRQQ